MMKKWRRLLPLLLCPLILAACAPGGGGPAPSEPDEPGRDPDVETLVYATVIYDDPLRDKVDQFNRTHEDVQIVVKEYTGETYQEGLQARDRFLVELTAGQVPDIIGGAAPFGLLARKGYLEDLWPYIESDPDLGRGNVMEAPLRAAEVDGGLYTAFSSVSIHTLVGQAGIVGDRIGWTLEELKEAYASMPEGSTILAPDATRSSVEMLLELSLERYVDWETGRCSFDCEEFRSSLEFLKSFPEVPPYDARAEEGGLLPWADVDEWLMGGHQLLEKAWIMDAGDIQTMDLRHGGRCAFVGYPVEEGGVGSCFAPSRDIVAISSTCGNKDAAWEFLRTVLMRETSFDSGIPVYRARYDIRKRALMSRGREVYVYYSQGASLAPPTQLPAMTEEQWQRFESFFNGIDRSRMDDSALLDLVLDAAAPYFAGDKTLDEAVAMIQNRAALYVNENR